MQAMNLEGVAGGAISEVGVTVPESGREGDGSCEFSLSEAKMPERMAMPSVPSYKVSRLLEKCSGQIKMRKRVKFGKEKQKFGGLTTTEDCQGTVLFAIQQRRVFFERTESFHGRIIFVGALEMKVSGCGLKIILEFISALRNVQK